MATIAYADVPSSAEAEAALIEGCPGLSLKTISSLHCQDFGADEPTEAVCRYKVVIRGKTVRDKTYFAIDAKGWHLIDTPGYCPAASRN